MLIAFHFAMGFVVGVLATIAVVLVYREMPEPMA
jgi:hypothetical protein